MFSPASSGKSKLAPTGKAMPPDGKTQTIKCQGCGQVGMIETDGHHRRHGFYLHERSGSHVVACCKCQPIQP